MEDKPFRAVSFLVWLYRGIRGVHSVYRVKYTGLQSSTVKYSQVLAITAREVEVK